MQLQRVARMIAARTALGARMGLSDTDLSTALPQIGNCSTRNPGFMGTWAGRPPCRCPHGWGGRHRRQAATSGSCA
jgi:hypothetical protein